MNPIPVLRGDTALARDDVMLEKNGMMIVLAVDGSPHSDAAVRLATEITWPPGTSIHVLAVAPEQLLPTGLSAEAHSVVIETVARVRRSRRDAAECLATQVAERLCADYRAAHQRAITVEADVREGRPAEVILERAVDIAADLLIIGARGLSAPGEFRLGSTAHKLAHYAPCSVLIARPAPHARPISVLLGADGSPEAQRAAKLLCALSLPRWAEITVLNVVEPLAAFPCDTASERQRAVAAMPEIITQALHAAAEVSITAIIERLRDCGAHVRSAIRFGHPAAELIRAAQEQDADLIVVGARGQTRAEPFRLGGVAQKIVKYAPCSVLVSR